MRIVNVKNDIESQRTIEQQKAKKAVNVESAKETKETKEVAEEAPTQDAGQKTDAPSKKVRGNKVGVSAEA